MTGFTVKVNDAACRAAFAKVTALTSFQVQQTALLNAAAMAEREIKLELGKHGKTPSAMVTITRGPRKGERTKRWLGPSPGGPGGSPGIFTGALRASVSHTRVRSSGDGYVTSVGPTTIYARALDQIHPYMEPTFERSKDALRDAYLNTVKRLLP